jgi:hypothetical protein
MDCQLAFDLDGFVAAALAEPEPPTRPDLHLHDHVVHWNSGGKDSEVALEELVDTALEQRYPLGNITVAHNNLGDEVEWHGTLDLAWRQAYRHGLRFPKAVLTPACGPIYSRRQVLAWWATYQDRPRTAPRPRSAP